MCVDREKVGNNLKIEAARRDQIVRRGKTCDEVAIYIYNYVYRGLLRIHTRTSRVTTSEFYEMVAYLLTDWTMIDDLPP